MDLCGSNSEPGWAPGRATVFVSAVCCPKCGSINLHSKGASKAGYSVRYICQADDCGHKFQMPLEAGKHPRVVRAL